MPTNYPTSTSTTRNIKFVVVESSASSTYQQGKIAQARHVKKAIGTQPWKLKNADNGTDRSVTGEK